MAAPDCPKCFAVSPAWGQANAAGTNVSCPFCGTIFNLQWLLSMNVGGPHTWDKLTTPAICVLCLVDAHNPAGAVPCPGVPTNWPGSSGTTSYPTCPCGMNDWVILQNAAFECNACLRQLTLAQLQFCGSKITLGPILPSVQPAQTKLKLPKPSAFFNWRPSDDDETPTMVPKPKPVYERCTQCDRELSKEMDAYYGKDPREAKKCRPCRTKKPF